MGIVTLPDKPTKTRAKGSPEENGLHIVSVSFPITIESTASVSVEKSVQLENLASVASALLVQLEGIEVGLQKISTLVNPLATDTAVLLEGATAAVDLAKRELGSEHPRIDVIRLCVLVLKWVATKGDVFVGAVLKGAGATAGVELAHKLLSSDLATVVAQLEQWLQLHI
jgi:hypothetical protein